MDKILSEEQSYTNSYAHLLDEKRRLDLIFSIQARAQQLQQTNDPAEQLKGYIISDAEINRILYPNFSYMDEDDELVRLNKQLEVVNDEINHKLVNSVKNGVFLPILYLIEQFNLSPFEEKCLLFALAPELDKKYEKLFAYIQNDINTLRPTLDLLVRLTCSSTEEQANALRTFHEEGEFYRFLIDHRHFDLSERSLMSQQLKLDERITSFLTQSAPIDKRIKHVAHIFNADDELHPLYVGFKTQEKMVRFIEYASSPDYNSKQGVIFYLHGKTGSGKSFLCQHVTRYFQQPLVVIDFKKVIHDDSFDHTVLHCLREAKLNRAMLLVENIDVLMDEDDKIQKKLNQFIYVLTSFSDVIFLTSTNRIKRIQLEFSKFLVLEEALEIPTIEERAELWQQFSSGYLFEQTIDYSALASKFRFTPGQIVQALYTAEKQTEWDQYGNRSITNDTLHRSCYLQAQHKLDRKATRLTPRYKWDDLILPDDEKQLLKHAANQMKNRRIVYGEWGFDKKLSYGKGLSILLSGPPGTGKTMSAEVVANDLNLEIYRVDLSQVVSKYIGETEKNLKEIFDEAQLSNAILFFDEADSLFSKRSAVNDSKDKYANLEVSFLLQKIEDYEGVSILATNYLQNVDEAFLRRITYIIKYSFPDENYREQIWRSFIPKEAPTDDIDYQFLAKKINLAGGNIKNIVVTAAFLAAENNVAISMKHIIYAAKHEMQKSGKILLREDLGEYYDML